LIESGAGATPVIRAGEVVGMLRLRDLEDLLGKGTWRSAPA
jgi:CBS domain-containing protein